MSCSCTIGHAHSGMEQATLLFPPEPMSPLRGGAAQRWSRSYVMDASQTYEYQPKVPTRADSFSGQFSRSNRLAKRLRRSRRANLRRLRPLSPPDSRGQRRSACPPAVPHTRGGRMRRPPPFDLAPAATGDVPPRIPHAPRSAGKRNLERGGG